MALVPYTTADVALVPYTPSHKGFIIVTTDLVPYTTAEVGLVPYNEPEISVEIYGSFYKDNTPPDRGGPVFYSKIYD